MGGPNLPSYIAQGATIALTDNTLAGGECSDFKAIVTPTCWHYSHTSWNVVLKIQPTLAAIEQYVTGMLQIKFVKALVGGCLRKMNLSVILVQI